MTLIFMDVNLLREHLSGDIQELIRNKKVLKHPQMMSIKNLFGEKILLLYKLARWYLKHDLGTMRI